MAQQPLDYETADTKAPDIQQARAKLAIWLAIAGYAVTALHFLFVTTIAHLLQPTRETYIIAYVVAVTAECLLSLTSMVKAGFALRPKGPAADRAMLALALAALLLLLATTCIGIAFVGDIS